MSKDWGWSNKWDGDGSITREEFDEVVEMLKNAPVRPTRYVMHVNKRLVDDFEANGLLGTLKECELIGSPEAIAYAEERIQAVLKVQ